MHPKGIEFETEHRCQYNREEGREIRLSGCSRGVQKDVYIHMCVAVYYRTWNPATLSKDRKGPLGWKILVERAGNLNQPMGMDSSVQVKLFY